MKRPVRDLKNYACTLPALPAVSIPSVAAQISATPNGAIAR